ncbi:MAG TPA: neutral/alkaline non-lysosomal ceramidase N-terminal domain-containing protein [Flavitalea sp.]|nr:neutral/alkaline non-lysosomal ceramidase N-terminal domain-containing protein [Flavitalea sp.]
MKVGIGRKVITPDYQPLWMNGYMARKEPGIGVAHDLWVKALVFEESATSRVIIVTTDLLGLSHEVSEVIADRLEKKYGITRSQLVLNSSHTHSGPPVWPSAGMFDYSTEDMRNISLYSHKLIEDIVEAVEMGMKNLTPMKVWSVHGKTEFARNRRDPKITYRPVDYDVPILKVATPDGAVKAILFGYACHNTTLDSDNLMISGDYAGYAQIELEKMYPGSTALFFLGCAGDIDPFPRGTTNDAVQHGKTLAIAVRQALGGDLKPVRAPISAEYANIDLNFPPFDLAFYQKEIVSTNPFAQRRAKLMILAYNKGYDVSKYHYPIHAIRFSKDLTILALAGEVVVDYSLWAKKKFADENLFVAAYSDEVMCYIPSKRILKEGGYEAKESMVYYVMPGPFDESVEQNILNGIQQVMKKVGVEPSSE